MPISFKKGLAVLRGALDIEEAERLLSALEKDPERQVDMGRIGDHSHRRAASGHREKAHLCSPPRGRPILPQS